MLPTSLLLHLLISCASEEAIKVHNSTPSITIISHSSGTILQDGYEIRLQAQVHDDNNESSSLSVQWTSNTRTLCPAETPTLDGVSLCIIAIEEGESLIRAQVTDPEGAAAIAEISIEVEPTFAPSVQIISPTTNGLYYSDQLILFSAHIQDTEDASADLSYYWESSLDGILPANGIPSEDGLLEEFLYLSEGTHALTLSVTDLSGKTTERSLSLQVGESNTNPNCAIVSPSEGENFLFGESIAFQATMSDAEMSMNELQVLWRSDKDGDLGSGLVNSSGEVNFSTSNLSANEHIIQFIVKDELNSTCSDSVVITIGTPPTINILNPSDGDVVTFGESTHFEASITDNEENPSGISLSWVSNIDGELSNQSPNSLGEIEFNTPSLSAGLHSITVTATDSSGLSDSDVFLLRVNRPPTAPTVSFASTPIFTNTDVFAQASGSIDLDGQSITYSYEWLKNGSLTSQTGIFLPKTATTKGEYWTVRVTPKDSYQSGPSTEASFLVQNSTPIITSFAQLPTEAYSTESLSCYGTATDADGDILSESYAWKNETTGISLGSAASLTLSPLFVKPGDSVRCTYSVSDGSDSTQQSSIMTIKNGAPTIDSLSIVPSAPYIGDIITCLGISSDPDLESTTTTYLWTNQTTGSTLSASSSLTLSNTNASPQDTIECTLTVTDDSGASISDSTTATIGNLPPTITSISLNTTTAALGDTLTCMSSESDPEGDIPTLSYLWRNTTSGLSLGNNASLTLTSGMVTGLDEISCTVTATDSYGASDTESISIVVSETSPEFISPATISPSSGVTTRSVLSCTASASDPDGTSISYQYEWKNGSNTLGSNPSLTLTPSIVSPTDVIECIVTAIDGAGEETTSSTSIMVGNTAPTLNSLSIVPNTNIRSNSTLTCSVNILDADLESITPTYAWKNGSTLLGSGSTFTLTPTMAQPGDTIQCIATAVDSYGATVSDSLSVSISNTLPEITSVSLSPSIAYNTSTITCTLTATDADNQSMTQSYSWSNLTDGTTISSSSSLTLDANLADRNDEIQCTATVTDSSGGSVSSTKNLTLTNRPPLAPSVSIEPSTAYVNSSLSCIPSNGSDPDGDSVIYTYSWKVNGGPVANTTSTFSNAFASGDTVQCTVTPSDGLISGSTTSTSIIIQNTKPKVDSITLSPSTIYTNDTITASAIASDIDGDSITLTYTWSVNQNQVQSDSTNTLAGSLFAKGDSVSVKVVATDGQADSTEALATTTISNSLPTTPSVSIFPAVPVEGVNDLVCTASGSTDADQDNVSYAFAWTVDGSVYTNASTSGNASTVSTADIAATEEWECTATPFDGEDSGTSYGVSVIVESGWNGPITFGNCSQTGRNGPTQSACDSAYTNTDLEGLVTLNSGIQQWEVPDTGTYQITVAGASGGNNTANSYTNGKGVQMRGDFSLNEGDILHILVGQRGDTYGYTGGGGGGSYVGLGSTYANSTPLIVGGGGGGAGDSGGNGSNATTATSGTNGHPSYGFGVNGYGNTNDSNGGWGSSGAGFYGNGSAPNTGSRALSFRNAGIGALEQTWTGPQSSSCSGAPGGFGGGGSGACNGGGGGGGYSGGGQGGGGGGSFNSGTNQSNGGTNSGHGFVIIDKL